MPSEPRVTHVLVKTFGGNTILPHDSWVWAKAGGVAVRKRVTDLRPGDKVLERNTSVNVSLGEIKRALLEDDVEYRKAHEELHTPDGRPKLQAFLQRALARNGFGQSELNNPAKFREAVGFIARRLGRADRLAGALYGERHTVRLKRGEDAIADWINGKTVLPADPKTLRMLRGLDRQAFDEIFGPKSELSPNERPNAAEHPVLWAHDFWQTTHQTLRSWVSGFTPQATGESGEPTDSTRVDITRPRTEPPGRSFAKQRQLVYDRLITPIHESIGEEHAFTRVKDVSLLTAREARAQTSPPHKGGPTLSRGVLPADKGRPSRLGLQEATVGDLLRQSGTMTLLARNLLEHADLPPEVEGDGIGKSLLALQLLDGVHEYPEGRDYIQLRAADGDSRAQGRLTRPQFEQALKGLSGQIVGGVIDARAGLPKGTTLKLLQHRVSIKNNIPDSVAQANRGVYAGFEAHKTRAAAFVRTGAPSRALSGVESARAPRTREETERQRRNLVRQLRRELGPHQATLAEYGATTFGVLMPGEPHTTPGAFDEHFEHETRLMTQALGEGSHYARPLSRQETVDALAKAGIPAQTAHKLINATRLGPVLE